MKYILILLLFGAIFCVSIISYITGDANSPSEGVLFGVMLMAAAIIPPIILLQLKRFNKPILTKIAKVLIITYTVASFLIGSFYLIIITAFGCGLFGDYSGCKSNVEIAIPILLWAALNIAVVLDIYKRFPENSA